MAIPPDSGCFLMSGPAIFADDGSHRNYDHLRTLTADFRRRLVLLSELAGLVFRDGVSSTLPSIEPSTHLYTMTDSPAPSSSTAGPGAGVLVLIIFGAMSLLPATPLVLRELCNLTPPRTLDSDGTRVGRVIQHHFPALRRREERVWSLRGQAAIREGGRVSVLDDVARLADE